MINLEILSQDRNSLIDDLGRRKRIELIVIGGGIHGAWLARLAALAGLEVVLLEQGDYATATSSRSSKMAHGGLRYLEMFDFKQVFEGIKCREELFEIAPVYCRPYPFLIPIRNYERWLKAKLGIGLSLYDWMVRDQSRKHKWIPLNDLNVGSSQLSMANLIGCYQYTDGLMDDAAIVQELILDARVRGALCLNYVAVTKVTNVDGNQATVQLEDKICGRKLECEAKMVVNCAGPWVEKIDPGVNNKHLFSRGVHLLFDRKWEGPAVFLPMPGKARYYFVWPHQGGTMVGTTESEINDVELDPIPTQSEVEEILRRIVKDLPESRLTRESLYYAFAGIRSLPLRGAKEAATISRRHIWDRHGSILSLFGGKYTTAAATAREGLALAMSHLGKPFKDSSSGLQLNRIGEIKEAAGISSNDPIEMAKLHVKYGQVCTLEDLMRLRLGLEYLPDHGTGYLERVASTLSWDRDSDKQAAIEGYMKRILTIKNTIQ